MGYFWPSCKSSSENIINLILLIMYCFISDNTHFLRVPRRHQETSISTFDLALMFPYHTVVTIVGIKDNLKVYPSMDGKAIEDGEFTKENYTTRFFQIFSSRFGTAALSSHRCTTIILNSRY